MGVNAAAPASAAARIGVFGGAFDPPHAAHRALTETALAQLQLDMLRIFPTGVAWHKPRALSPASDRIAMARLAFGDLPQVVVDERETRRPGPTYTVDTLRELRAEFPQAALFLLIGGDQARALPGWQQWWRLPELATLCVAERDVGGPADGARPWAAALLDAGVPAHRMVRLQLPAMDVSATAIRHRLAAGHGVVPLVAEPVARYIAEHQLYHHP